jgi:CO/xanthine dehydrogenase Mo-binding subunit
MRDGKQAHSTSAFLRQAFDRGSEQFKWKERIARPKKSGTKVRGVGVSSSAFFAGSVGYDGLFVIRPDGRIAIQSGIGNLGTESISDVHRVVAEILGVPWEKCDSEWGNTGKNLRGPASPVEANNACHDAGTRGSHGRQGVTLRRKPTAAGRNSTKWPTSSSSTSVVARL